MTTTIKEKPILFSAPMVRAILAGRKTMTRRVVKPQPFVDKALQGYNRITWWPKTAREVSGVMCPMAMWRDGMPIGETGAADIQRISPFPVGTQLWVRETFRPIMSGLYEGGWDYRADDPSASGVGFVPWKPSIFMPRRASRITLQVEEVRVERLQEITEADAIAEGMHKFHGVAMYGYDPNGTPGDCVGGSFRGAFALLWEKINGPESWDANPFVWCVSFSVVKP